MAAAPRALRRSGLSLDFGSFAAPALPAPPRGGRAARARGHARESLATSTCGEPGVSGSSLALREPPIDLQFAAMARLAAGRTENSLGIGLNGRQNAERPARSGSKHDRCARKVARQQLLEQIRSVMKPNPAQAPTEGNLPIPAPPSAINGIGLARVR